MIICSRKQAAQIQNYDWIISINDPGTRPPPFNRQAKVKVLHFEDSIDNEVNGPNVNDIQEIIEFAINNSSINGVIHCAAGISRSTATALIWAHVHGFHNHQVWNFVQTLITANAIAGYRNTFWDPNIYMLTMADKIMGSRLATNR